MLFLLTLVSIGFTKETLLVVEVTRHGARNPNKNAEFNIPLDLGPAELTAMGER